VLGLDALVDAQDVLQKARTTREKEQKEADQQRRTLLDRLATLSDERAARVKEALGQKDWGLDDVEAVLAGSTTSGEKDSALDLLQRLSVLQPPDPAKVREATKALRDADQRQVQAAQTVAGKSDELASLLDHALRFHKAHGDGDCPVCGRTGALDKAWHEAKQQEAESLRRAAKEASEARANLKQRIAEARKLVEIDTALLKKAEAAGFPDLATAARAAAEKAIGQQGEPPAADLVAAIESGIDSLVTSLDQLRTRAQQELEGRQDAWRPHARDLNEWLPRARKARKAAESLPDLKSAEKWMKEAADAIRNERFAPIAEKTRAIWNQLKLQSNVSLEKVHLGGSGKARKVELKVTVDGQEGAALGVMSQGELHSLALSLFIPRATLAESPFRFMVIDDPVQSMDPSRVDGLARVLQAASKDRQVVVFTHDDRLPEAVRRLGIQATQIEVSRKEGSQVALRQAKDPVSRYIEDAFTLAKTDDLPQEVARRVVPGLCRQAIEAACMEAIRRRRIGRGEPHADVEDLLAGITGTKSLAALALFDDKDRAGDVLPRLDRESKTSADTFRAVNEGSHEGLNGDILAVVRNSEKLANWMQALA
jgi:ABC-type lipoprotein export system ATPase subunit